MKSSARGFTLIEVLVVMVIVGVLAGLVVFSVGNKPQKEQLVREAQRLQHLLRLTQDEALFQNNEWGVEVHENRYTFYRLNPKNEWEKIQKDNTSEKDIFSAWHEHALPEHLWVRLTVEDHPTLGVSEEPQQTEQDNTQAPPLVLLSSGEYTPFVIEFGFEKESATQVRLSGDGLNDIELILGDGSDAARKK